MVKNGDKSCEWSGLENITYRSFMRIVEPLQQLDRGAFTAAAAANQRDGLPALHAQGQVM